MLQGMNDDEIPPLLPPDQMPPVVDQASLHHTWRALMGELGFGRAQMWVLFLQHGRQLHLGHLEDLPDEIAPADVRRVVRTFRAALREGRGVTCAFLYCRPGGSTRTQQDQVWLATIAEANPEWPVHLATDESLSVYAPDDRMRASA